MFKKLFLFSVVFCFVSGCATITTIMWPSVEHEYIGKERILDNTVGYEYFLSVNDRVLNVEGVPYCLEKAPKYKLTKKQHRGIVFIIIETPIWGLGLADWALSYVVSKASEETSLEQYVPTGIKKQCGNKMVPAEGKIMIQNSHSGEIFWVDLDENGNFSLFSFLGKYKGTRPFNIFFHVENESKYLSTIWW